MHASSSLKPEEAFLLRHFPVPSLEHDTRFRLAIFDGRFSIARPRALQSKIKNRKSKMKE
jgi:hypothetical protein